MTSTNAFTELCPGCFAEKGTVNICYRCGYDESLKRGSLVLAHRTLLHHGQYLIGKVLGKPGGFGITYLALDTRLDTRVAIKEYLPRDLAGRDGDHTTINAHSVEDGEHFRYGLTQFLQEARTLAQFDHANIVRVRNFFEENGTGYLVMDYYDGITLAGYLAQQPQGRLPEKAAVAILMPILDGLREVHAKNFLHRDIKPQNIYLTTGNRAILLDFGAARQAMGERSRSLSVVLSEGYAPYEQYHRRGVQGPWTDIYACAAVLYHAVAGEPPPPATERIPKDELDIAALGLSASLTKALQSGLATDHKLRRQRMADFQALLLGCEEAIEVEERGQNPIKADLPTSPVEDFDIHLNAHGEITAVIPVSPTQVNRPPRLKALWALLLVFLVSIGIAILVNANKQEKKTEAPAAKTTGVQVAVSAPSTQAPIKTNSNPIHAPGSIQCKVNDKDIAESYTGECKDGLAHGQGIAKGRDEYRGAFVNGNTEGLGVYIWGINSEWSGQSYEGSNKNNKRHGFGTWMVAKNSKNTRLAEYFKKIGKDEGGSFVWRGYFENNQEIFQCDSDILCKENSRVPISPLRLPN